MCGNRKSPRVIFLYNMSRCCNSFCIFLVEQTWNFSYWCDYHSTICHVIHIQKFWHFFKCSSQSAWVVYPSSYFCMLQNGLCRQSWYPVQTWYMSTSCISKINLRFLRKCFEEYYWRGIHVASVCNTDTTPTQSHRNSHTHRTKNITTNVVIQQNSRKLLMIDILMSETC